MSPNFLAIVANFLESPKHPQGAYVIPLQIPTKVDASPIFRLFLGTDLQRFYNGLRTV